MNISGQEVEDVLSKYPAVLEAESDPAWARTPCVFPEPGRAPAEGGAIASRRGRPARAAAPVRSAFGQAPAGGARFRAPRKMGAGS